MDVHCGLPEGYVVVDSGNAVKFVDRLEFSRFNFAKRTLANERI